MKNSFFILICMWWSMAAVAQDSVSNQTNPEARSISQKRQWLVGGASLGIYTGSLLVLNNTWYREYPKTAFHTFNDSREWLQVDKVGHAWSAYNLSRASTVLWRWALRPVSPEEGHAVLLGTISGFSYLTVIELLDAHSANWGWSWPDMAANFSGSGLFAAQELLWKEQRVQFKFSAHPNQYETSLRVRADDLYGSSFQERLLKDYNAQTYWFSFNIKSFVPKAKLPSWLSVSIGYGAEGLFGGFSNLAYDEDGNIKFDRRDIKRYRQWFLSPDIDLTKIKTKSKFLQTLLSAANAIKIPAPAIEFSNNKLKLKALAF